MGPGRCCSSRHRQGHSAKTLQRYPHVDRGGRRTAVTEDIAHHLNIGSRINLPTCVAVAKGMRTNHLGWNSRQPGVVPNTVPDGAVGYRLIGNVLAQEKGMN